LLETAIKFVPLRRRLRRWFPKSYGGPARNGSHFITFFYLISTLSVASERPPVRWQPHISNLKGRTADSDGGTSGIINKSSISSAAGGKGAKCDLLCANAIESAQGRSLAASGTRCYIRATNPKSRAKSAPHLRVTFLKSLKSLALGA
jgi:hypothetical protein